MKYIDFNDKTLPIGKRKQAYVRWAISKGTDLIVAKRQANEKFGFEQKEGIFAIVEDHGRMEQRSFRQDEIFDGHDLRKYKHWKYGVNLNDDEIEKIKVRAKEKGWDVIFVTLVP